MNLLCHSGCYFESHYFYANIVSTYAYSPPLSFITSPEEVKQSVGLLKREGGKEGGREGEVNMRKSTQGSGLEGVAFSSFM